MPLGFCSNVRGFRSWQRRLPPPCGPLGIRGLLTTQDHTLTVPGFHLSVQASLSTHLARHKKIECVCHEQWIAMLTVDPPPILSFFQHQKHSGNTFGKKRSSCLAWTRQSFRGALSEQGCRGLEACCKL